MRFVALLRGVNVGGRAAVAMADLRAAFEAGGFAGATTYINSGNVLFESAGRRSALEPEIEAVLEHRFGWPIAVVVRSHAELRAVVDRAPGDFGAAGAHCDTIFLKAPLTAEAAMQVLERREGVDQAWPGTGVVYFARASHRLAESRLSRVVNRPAYKQMTIRSWRTTTRLLALLDQAPSG